MRWTEAGISGVLLPTASGRSGPRLEEGSSVPPFVREAIDGIVAVMTCAARDLRDVPIDDRGVDPFRRAVYAAIREIGPGTNRSYGEVARSIGYPVGTRACPGRWDYAPRMDEQASFEARAVLAPRRARLARLALLLPVVALVAIAWAGLSGPRSDKATADITDPTAVAAPSFAVEAPYPAQVIGLGVQRLDDVQPRGLGRDDVIAVAGWYVATAITDCPPLAAIYRQGSLPEIRGDADELAFCVRSGVLYASRPDLTGSLPTNSLEDDRSRNAGLPSVAVTVVVGVVVPPELEMIGTDATEVVVVGRFVELGDACRVPTGCRELLVDHVAWTPGA